MQEHFQRKDSTYVRVNMNRIEMITSGIIIMLETKIKSGML